MKTSISKEHPFGVKHIVVHRHLFSQRVIIDPENPASVIEGLRKLVSYQIEKVEEVDKENPKHEEWIQAVRRRETLLSFDDWCNKPTKVSIGEPL